MKRIIIPKSLIPALRDGTKTQHRVPLKRQLPDDGETVAYGMYHPTLVRKDGEEYPGPETFGCFTPDGDWGLPCPYQPGDQFWVAETWASDVPGCESQRGITYRADHLDPRGDGPAHPIMWRSPATMPRWAARFVLTITDVRVERVQDISEADAAAEGIPPSDTAAKIAPSPIGPIAIGRRPNANVFALVSHYTIPGAWTRNDWVWVPTFTVRRVPGGGR